MREELIKNIKSYYISSRVKTVDKDFLEFEEELADLKDLEKLLLILRNKEIINNLHNSILLYVTGASNQFNFEIARAETKGGSPPDIDIDTGALTRDRLVELIIEDWGRENVANIITHGTLKLKSLTRKFFKLTTGESNNPLMYEILDKIPEPLFGFEATLKECIEGNEEKGYKPNPDLKTNKKYAEWYAFANSLENMVCNFGMHPAGLVLSNEPIQNTIPIWSSGKSERITQFDLQDTETMGLIKYDFLVINNLDIIKQCTKLIYKNHNKNYDIYNIPDENPKAYKLLASGYVGGIFQFETSAGIKKLLMDIQPKNIQELGDISAMFRPGPLEAGFDKTYLDNKNNSYPPNDIPKEVANILADTYWTLIYQEQVMFMAAKLANFDLQEADNLRRAIGKQYAAFYREIE